MPTLVRTSGENRVSGAASFFRNKSYVFEVLKHSGRGGVQGKNLQFSPAVLVLSPERTKFVTFSKVIYASRHRSDKCQFIIKYTNIPKQKLFRDVLHKRLYYFLSSIPLPARSAIIASATAITSSLVRVLSGWENTILTVIDLPFSSS